MEEFEFFLLARFTPSLHPFTLIFSCLSQSKSCLTKLEWFCERDDFTLSLIHGDSRRLKPAHNESGNFLQLFNVRHDNIVVIHIMAGTVNPELTLNKVVDCAWKRNHLLLAWLYSKRHSSTWAGTRRIRHNEIRQRPYILIHNVLSMTLINKFVICVWEEPFLDREGIQLLPCRIFCSAKIGASSHA